LTGEVQVVVEEVHGKKHAFRDSSHPNGRTAQIKLRCRRCVLVQMFWW
jgi:hypothetical protein